MEPDHEHHRPATAPSADCWPPWVENFVLPYLHIRALWLVFSAVLMHVVLVLVLVMLPVLRTRSLPAIGGLFVFFMLSASLIQAEWAIRRRPAEFTLLLALVWGTAMLSAILLKDTGYL